MLASAKHQHESAIVAYISNKHGDGGSDSNNKNNNVRTNGETAWASSVALLTMQEMWV